MEYLQYFKGSKERVVIGNVLNLVISGIPSIQELKKYSHSIFLKF